MTPKAAPPPKPSGEALAKLTASVAKLKTVRVGSPAIAGANGAGSGLPSPVASGSPATGRIAAGPVAESAAAGRAVPGNPPGNNGSAGGIRVAAKPAIAVTQPYSPLSGTAGTESLPSTGNPAQKRTNGVAPGRRTLPTPPASIAATPEMRQIADTVGLTPEMQLEVRTLVQSAVAEATRQLTEKHQAVEQRLRHELEEQERRLSYHALEVVNQMASAAPVAVPRAPVVPAIALEPEDVVMEDVPSPPAAIASAAPVASGASRGSYSGVGAEAVPLASGGMPAQRAPALPPPLPASPGARVPAGPLPGGQHSGGQRYPAPQRRAVRSYDVLDIPIDVDIPFAFDGARRKRWAMAAIALVLAGGVLAAAVGAFVSNL